MQIKDNDYHTAPENAPILLHPKRGGSLETFDQGDEFALIEACVPTPLANAFRERFEAIEGCRFDMLARGEQFTLIDACVPTALAATLQELFDAYAG
jgi:uncharacterized protein (DUF2249 family)